MNLTITITQHGKKSKSISTPVSELNLADLRKIWEAEGIINTIPGANLRIYFEVK